MKKYISLLIWIVALQLIGFGFGSMTKAGMDPWYLALNRSALTPPDYWFGLVWSALYVLIAISGWLIWQANEKVQVKNAYIAQLLFNWAWTPLFFYYHLIGAALLCIIVIILLTLLIIIKTWHSLKPVAVLLMPYLLWLIFAAYLNGVIWVNN